MARNLVADLEEAFRAAASAKSDFGFGFARDPVGNGFAGIRVTGSRGGATMNIITDRVSLELGNINMLLTAIQTIDDRLGGRG